MKFMFAKCYNLREIKGINNLNTISVTNMSSMFQECKKLEIWIYLILILLMFVICN